MRKRRNAPIEKKKKEEKREREVLGSIKEARFVWKETDISCIKWSNLSRWIQSRMDRSREVGGKPWKTCLDTPPPPPLFPFPSRCAEDLWCQFLARRIGRKLPVGKYSSLMHKVWLSGYRDWTVPLCSLIRFWKWKNRSTIFLVKLSWQRGNYAKGIVRRKIRNVRFSITGMISRKQWHVKWNLPLKFKRRICYIYLSWYGLWQKENFTTEDMRFERDELMEFLMLVSFPSWFIYWNWTLWRFFSPFREKKIYLLINAKKLGFLLGLSIINRYSSFDFTKIIRFTLLYFFFF